jgi:hypothetical protein
VRTNDNQINDIPKIKDYKESDVEVIQGDIKNAKDEADLVKKINERLSQYKKSYFEIKTVAERNREYWRGTQTDKDDLYEGENPISINRTFQSIETIIPIVTRKTPEPNVTVYPGSKNNLVLQEKIERLLKEQWEVEQDLQGKTEEALRILFCQRYVAIKYDFDRSTGEMKFTLMPMGKILFPFEYPNVDECPFIIEFAEDTLANLKEKFPEKAQELEERVKAKGGSVSDDSLVSYLEYWENKFYACLFEDVLLTLEDNPHWNYDNEELNHFKSARKPYIFLNHLLFGDSMLDDTSLIEQASTIQDSINKRKRQIELNAGLANGKMVIAGNKMSKEVADNISNDPEEKIYLEGADMATGAIEIISGRGVGQEVFNDMAHSESQIDNIMGTHSTTRGERDTQETATGRAILKESDTGRLEILTRRIEKWGQEIYNAMVQLAYVYYEEQHPIHYSTEKGDNRILSASERLDYIVNTEFEGVAVKVLVQRGSTIPRDKSTEKAEAVDLWKNKGMATIDMYNILEYPNAEKLARNSYLENNTPEKLYTAPDGGFDITAMQHIYQIVHAESPEEATVKPFVPENPDDMAKHIMTHQEYLKGTNIDPDLPNFYDLDANTRSFIIDHVMQEVQFASEMGMSTTELPPPSEEQLPPEQGLPPEMAGGLPPEATLPPEAQIPAEAMAA